MIKIPHLKELLLLHFVVLLFGFTGILGKLISIPSDWLVWYRMLIASIGLVFYAIVTKQFKIPLKIMIRLWGIGGIIAVHWICFFEAIKITGVSIALSCLASAAFFTAIIEPVFLKTTFQKKNILLGICVIIGIMLMFKTPSGNIIGILTAILSAFLAALFTVLNAVKVKKHPPATISTHEIIGGFAILTAYMLIAGKITFFVVPASVDWLWLILLGLICTSFAFVASVKVMKKLSAFTVALSVNLEPVYAILMAFVIFNEHHNLNVYFYIGVIIILVSVFSQGLINKVSSKIKGRTST